MKSLLFYVSIVSAILYAVFRFLRLKFTAEILIGTIVLHLIYGLVSMKVEDYKKRYVAFALFLISLTVLFRIQHYPFGYLLHIIFPLVYIAMGLYLLNDFPNYKNQVKMVYVGVASLTTLLIALSGYVYVINTYRDYIILIHSFSLLCYLIDEKFKNEGYKVMFVASIIPLVPVIQNFFY